MKKDRLRAEALTARRTLPDSERRLKSRIINQRLESLELFKSADRILFYFSQEEEVDTRPLIEKYLASKKLFLPRLTSGSSFIALPFESTELLLPGLFGIREPKQPEDGVTSETDFDLIIVPGVAFDRRGTRLGMGKGYYDRFLSGQKATKKVALAFSQQILDEVPKGPYDENVDMIITENEVIRCIK